MCQRDWPLEGTPIGPLLPTLDSVKSVGNSEKQHIPVAHLLSTLGETHRQPSPARMGDSQQQGALRSFRRVRLDALFPPFPLPSYHSPTSPPPQGEERSLSSTTPEVAQPVTSPRTCVCLFSELQEHLHRALQSPTEIPGFGSSLIYSFTAIIRKAPGKSSGNSKTL